MYKNGENMLTWTKHFKGLCSWKTDCEISFKNYICKCLVARKPIEILLKAMGRKRADAALPIQRSPVVKNHNFVWVIVEEKHHSGTKHCYTGTMLH